VGNSWCCEAKGSNKKARKKKHKIDPVSRRRNGKKGGKGGERITNRKNRVRRHGGQMKGGERTIKMSRFQKKRTLFGESRIGETPLIRGLYSVDEREERGGKNRVRRRKIATRGVEKKKEKRGLYAKSLRSSDHFWSGTKKN